MRRFAAFGFFVSKPIKLFVRHLLIAIFLLIIHLALLAAQGGVKPLISTVESCSWTYRPGEPYLEAEDSLNPTGSIRQWENTGITVIGEYLVPVRIINVILPLGTQPNLQISSIKTKQS